MKNRNCFAKIHVKIKYLRKAMFLVKERVEEIWYLVFCFDFTFVFDKFFIFYSQLLLVTLIQYFSRFIFELVFGSI